MSEIAEAKAITLYAILIEFFLIKKIFQSIFLWIGDFILNHLREEKNYWLRIQKKRAE